MSLFWLFREFDDFRHQFGPHFGHFWRSWETSLVIFRCIEISMNFMISPDTPQVERRRQVEGLTLVPGCTSRLELTPDCWSADQINQLLSADCWFNIEKVMLLKGIVISDCKCGFAAWWPLASRGRRIYIYTHICAHTTLIKVDS